MNLSGRKPDRRIQRTRKLLLDAFRDLVLERGFARVMIRDVIDRANVGRSTFYEHFEDKDDILQQSIAPLFEVFAATVDDPTVTPHLIGIVRHLAENGRTGRVAFTGQSGRILAKFLGHLIQLRLEARMQNGGARPVVPLELAGRQLAQSQLALIEAWLDDESAAGAEAVATALARATYAAATAFLAAPGS